MTDLEAVPDAWTGVPDAPNGPANVRSQPHARDRHTVAMCVTGSPTSHQLCSGTWQRYATGERGPCWCPCHQTFQADQAIVLMGQVEQCPRCKRDWDVHAFGVDQVVRCPVRARAPERR